MAITTREISIRFAAPKVDVDRVAIKGRICELAESLALLVHELVPASREQSEAIAAVESAVAWAHAGIDRRYVARSERKPLDLAQAEAACMADISSEAARRCPDALPAPACADEPDQ